MLTVQKCKSYTAALEYSKKVKGLVAVETEYGNDYFGVKDGAEVELLHHGEFEDNPPACLSFYKQKIDKVYDNFIVSHIDTDAILGIMWAAGFLKPTKLVLELCQLIGNVDINGFHWFMEHKYNKINNNIQEKFLAIGSLVSSWKFNNINDSEDISRMVHKLILRIKDLIMFNVPDDVKERNINFIEKKEIIKNSHLVKELSLPGVMVVYKGDTFLLDGYLVNDISNDIVVHYNIGSNTISMSCKNEKIAKRYFGENGVVEPLQNFFGENAGGRMTVGGSARDIKLQDEFLDAFIAYLRREYLNS